MLFWYNSKITGVLNLPSPHSYYIPIRYSQCPDTASVKFTHIGLAPDTEKFRMNQEGPSLAVCVIGDYTHLALLARSSWRSLLITQDNGELLAEFCYIWGRDLLTTEVGGRWAFSPASWVWESFQSCSAIMKARSKPNLTM